MSILKLNQEFSGNSVFAINLQNHLRTKESKHTYSKSKISLDNKLVNNSGSILKIITNFMKRISKNNFVYYLVVVLTAPVE